MANSLWRIVLIVSVAAALLPGCAPDYVHHPVTGQKALDAYYGGQGQVPSSLFSEPSIDQPVIVQQEPGASYEPHPQAVFGPNGQTAIIAPGPNGGGMIFGPNGQTTIITP
jgi:hypothetical protein